MPTPEWAERLLARDRDAVSPALNLVDDTRPEAIEATRKLLDEIESAGLDRALPAHTLKGMQTVAVDAVVARRPFSA